MPTLHLLCGKSTLAEHTAVVPNEAEGLVIEVHRP